jgi:glutathione S-transferase
MADATWPAAVAVGRDIRDGRHPAGLAGLRLVELPIQRPDLPHLADWYARLRERPAYQRGVMSPLT